MAQLTLLDMTQNILSHLDSDEVNSISDTVESMQVARIIRTKYYDILTRAGSPPQQQLIQLTASGDVLKPVLMTVPDTVSKIHWIKYFDEDTDSSMYKYVTLMSNDQFIDHINAFDPDQTNVSSFNFAEGGNNFTFYYKDDAQPNYCTLISNLYFVFDSYDSDFDTTLQSSKTMCMGDLVPIFTLSDSFIPPLDDNQFPLLVNEAKALAFFELKQTPHPKAEQEIKRQWSSMQKNKSIVDKPSHFDQLPDFGRTGSRVTTTNRWMRQKGPVS